MAKVKLGSKYRDKVHGTVGIAASRTEYLSGCARVGLEYIDKDGEIKSRIFDEPQIEIAKEIKVKTARGKDRGGPGEVAPKKDCPVR